MVLHQVLKAQDLPDPEVREVPEVPVVHSVHSKAVLQATVGGPLVDAVLA